MEPSIETFYKSVAQSPAALSELTAGVQTPDEFIDRAVSIGNEQGYQFTREEATTWINSQIEARKSGELSDVQLEGVAGGKGGTIPAINTASSGVNTGVNYLSSGVNTAVSAISSGVNTAGNAVGNWFSSW